MKRKVWCLLLSLTWLVQVAQGSRQHIWPTVSVYQKPAISISRFFSTNTQFTKSLRYNIYTFTVTAADSGRVREVKIKAYRGELLLTNFHIKVDGAVVGAEVADLDNNRFPELYVYSASDGSGSFGRVYAWQFLPERKADITPVNWRSPLVKGYMGHDIVWAERNILCRKFPVYASGDANAEPSGGYQMIRYKLQASGTNFALVAE
ncbi:PliI family lysozyme inhibitor of I-type lysozyme [Spirosoma pollinicola]|uniref:M1 family peptidase n=1 Tax=Spirosoma pollinicola TaxID=2057025 RepID=A0A2K8YYL9_9BACT|nr:PliI family lysozyme inhibitor of I-type lysozyme [Spirosoma pollinicola]AUD02674.1 hypothetical protein CWM47_13005 [Spirosoma pollinicola]